jgi:CRISPR-associated protein Cmr6
MSNRRNDVNGIKPILGSTHAGMWLERYRYVYRQRGANPNNSPDYAEHHLLQASRLLPSSIYNERYAEWLKDVRNLQSVRLVKLTTSTRLVVGHASQVVLESGLQLHHTYGTPIIPGSSIKGLLAHYAHKSNVPEWNNPSNQAVKDGETRGAYATMLLGDTERAGYVSFLDAMWVPSDVSPLSKDVISVHQSEYYRDPENKIPSDTDSPIVVAFLSVKKNQTFLLPIIGPTDWVDLSVQLLTAALATQGIGAKTNAGYGRMQVKEFVDPDRQTVLVDPDQQAVLNFMKNTGLDTFTQKPQRQVVDKALSQFNKLKSTMNVIQQKQIAQVLCDAMRTLGMTASSHYISMRNIVNG